MNFVKQERVAFLVITMYTFLQVSLNTKQMIAAAVHYVV